MHVEHHHDSEHPKTLQAPAEQSARANVEIIVTAGTAMRLRPVCVFPLRRKYLGVDVDEATSFRCE